MGVALTLLHRIADTLYQTQIFRHNDRINHHE